MNTQLAAGFVINIDPADGGVFQVVDSDQLFDLTQQGWRLVAMLPVTVPMRPPTLPYNPHFHDGRPPPEPTVYGSSFHCLLRRDEESALAVKTREIELLSERLHDALKAVAEVTQLRKWVEDQKEEIKLLSERDERLRQSLRETQDKNRRIELDIGKLRKEIGEREFMRIVGEAKP